MGVQGEFYTENAAARLVQGEFCTGMGGVWRVLGELFRASRHCAWSCRRRGAVHVGGCGGFALHEAVAQRVAGVSDPHVVQFPPSGAGGVATRGAKAPKLQTTSLNSAENELLWLKWSAFWATAPETVRGPVWRSRVIEGPIDLVPSSSLHGLLECPWHCGAWPVDNGETGGTPSTPV